MAKAPIMPLFTDALIGDTTHLSAEQFGCYLLILIATWRNNGVALPDDDERMAKVCRVSRWKWKSGLRKIVAEFFTVSELGWHQQRLEKEWNRVSGRLQSARASAKAGGLAKRKQPINHNHKESSSSLPSSARAPGLAMGPEHARGNGARSIGAVLNVAIATPPSAEDHRLVEQRQKHVRFLLARCCPADVELYYAASLSDNPTDAQRMFDLTDARMQADRWDDHEGVAT